MVSSVGNDANTTANSFDSIEGFVSETASLCAGFFTKLTVGLCALDPAWALLPVLKIPVLKRLLDKV